MSRLPPASPIDPGVPAVAALKGTASPLPAVDQGGPASSSSSSSSSALTVGSSVLGSDADDAAHFYGPPDDDIPCINSLSCRTWWTPTATAANPATASRPVVNASASPDAAGTKTAWTQNDISTAAAADSAQPPKPPPTTSSLADRPLAHHFLQRDIVALRPFMEDCVVHAYSVRTTSWIKRSARAVVCSKPFAKGAMRTSHYCYVIEDPASPSNAQTTTVANITQSVLSRCPAAPSAAGRPLRLMVAKRYIDSRAASVIFTDAHMHTVASYWADTYNRMDPPKSVTFNEASVLELVERSPPLVLGLEPHLAGDYVKHNNNLGYVNEARNTPHAFLHFTYHFSGKTLLICDIQGVGDVFTDPQIHTREGDDFGVGNFGLDGMRQCLETHKCNAVCRQLNLPPITVATDPILLHVAPTTRKNVKPLPPDTPPPRPAAAAPALVPPPPVVRKSASSGPMLAEEKKGGAFHRMRQWFSTKS